MISAAGPELLRPREDLRRVGERFAGVWHYQCSLSLSLAVHEASYFLAGAEMIVPKR